MMKPLTEAQLMSFGGRLLPPNRRLTSPEDECYQQDRELARKHLATRRAIETLLEERRLKAQLEM